jgi:hypothetical protein
VLLSYLYEYPMLLIQSFFQSEVVLIHSRSCLGDQPLANDLNSHGKSGSYGFVGYFKKIIGEKDDSPSHSISYIFTSSDVLGNSGHSFDEPNHYQLHRCYPSLLAKSLHPRFLMKRAINDLQAKN